MRFNPLAPKAQYPFSRKKRIALSHTLACRSLNRSNVFSMIDNFFLGQLASSLRRIHEITPSFFFTNEIRNCYLRCLNCVEESLSPNRNKKRDGATVSFMTQSDKKNDFCQKFRNFKFSNIKIHISFSKCELETTINRKISEF